MASNRPRGPSGNSALKATIAQLEGLVLDRRRELDSLSEQARRWRRHADAVALLDRHARALLDLGTALLLGGEHAAVSDGSADGAGASGGHPGGPPPWLTLHAADLAALQRAVNACDSSAAGSPPPGAAPASGGASPSLASSGGATTPGSGCAQRQAVVSPGSSGGGAPCGTPPDAGAPRAGRAAAAAAPARATRPLGWSVEGAAARAGGADVSAEGLRAALRRYVTVVSPPLLRLQRGAPDAAAAGARVAACAAELLEVCALASLAGGGTGAGAPSPFVAILMQPLERGMGAYDDPQPEPQPAPPGGCGQGGGGQGGGGGGGGGEAGPHGGASLDSVEVSCPSGVPGGGAASRAAGAPTAGSGVAGAAATSAEAGGSLGAPAPAGCAAPGAQAPWLCPGAEGHPAPGAPRVPLEHWQWAVKQAALDEDQEEELLELLGVIGQRIGQLEAQRPVLAAAAAAAGLGAADQEPLIEGLAAAQRSYQVLSSAALLAIYGTIMSPEQAARFHISCYPYVCSLGGLRTTLRAERAARQAQQEADAAAAAAQAAAQAAQRNATPGRRGQRGAGRGLRGTAARALAGLSPGASPAEASAGGAATALCCAAATFEGREAPGFGEAAGAAALEGDSCSSTGELSGANSCRP